MARKTKIVLDADVIIHFIKGEHLFTLFNIFPEYEYVVLSTVYNELNITRRTMIDGYSGKLKKVSIVPFTPTGESIKEYFRLTDELLLGEGESACMVYCNENKDVLGSSNLTDIHTYCQDNSITYLTTIDFLYYAFVRGIMSEEECDTFIHNVRAKNSILPAHITNIATYTCNVAL